VSDIEQMGSGLRKPSEGKVRQVRECLDDFIENELEFAPKFDDAIQRSERDMTTGKPARVREPQGS
jgi:hypothetical protein